MGQIQSIGGNPNWARLEGAYAKGNALPTSTPSSSGTYRVNTSPLPVSKPTVLSPSGGTVYDSLGNVYKSPATEAYEARLKPSIPTKPTPTPVSAPATQTLATVGSAVTTASVLTAGNPVGIALAAGVLINLALLNANANAIGSLIEANAGKKKAEEVAATAEARYQEAVKNSQKANPINTKGSSSSSTPTGGLGGQTVGVEYGLWLTYDVQRYGSLVSSINRNGPFSIAPPLQSISSVQGTGSRQFIVVTDASGSREITLASASDGLSISGFNPQVERGDGQPDTPTPNTGFTPSPDTLPKEKPDNPGASPDFFPWLPVIQVQNDPKLAYKDAYGEGSPSFDNRPFKEPEKPLFAPALATAPSQSPTASSTPLPSAVSSPASGSNANPSPVSTTPTNPSISPSQAPNGLTSPLTPPTVTKPQTTPNTPSAPNIGDIVTILGTIGLGVTAITNKTNKIDNQTTPTAQQVNAKQGVCDAMQPQQCGYEGVKQATTEATNPIKDIANDNKGVLASILANLLGLGTLIINKFSQLFNFLDINAKVEAVKSTLTLALTLHNALMLSQSLGDTLGLILDNVLNVFGNTFRSTDGSQISASQYLGATVQQWIINVIGAENYASLQETLAIANRIYQTGMNVVNTVQGILDSAASVAQATGINVAKIGNALRDESVVSPRAYTHMDDTAVGNRPTTLSRFTALTTTLSDLDSKAQNLVTITAAPIQVKESIKQSKEDIKAFNDARDLNSQTNRDAKAARLEEIKLLKPLSEATVGKRDDDT